MKNTLAGLIAAFGLCCALPSASGQTAESTPAPQGERQPDAGGRRAREFQGDDLSQVLRLLARQAKINLVVGEAVKGNVTMRLENATALDAVETLVHQYHLSMTKDDKGIYYVNPPEAPDAALDLMAKPQTADRVAAYIHNLYNSLIKEGFTKEESLQIVASIDPGTVISAFGQKPDAPPAK